MKFYTYSKCATCRRAMNWLKNNNLDFELINIIENPPSKDLLIAASIQLGDRKYLFNTTGMSYRKLGAKAVKAYSDNMAFDALVADPKLIKRPFLIDQNQNFLVGFNEAIWRTSLLN